MKRKIITIDENLCDGCGNCASACSEGALQIIDGKAKLVKEDFCDGFGDCMGECPTGALKIEEKESRPFDIQATKDYLLRTRGKEAVTKMEEAQRKHEGHEKNQPKPLPCGCPGSLSQTIKLREKSLDIPGEQTEPQLRNWPVQITLLPLKAPYYENADLLVAADCCAYAHAGFHGNFIKGHTLAVGCPKLDNAAAYTEKLAAIIRGNTITSVAIAYMEVPCCTGLVRLVEEAVRLSGKKIPVHKTQFGIRGNVLQNK